MLHTTPRCTLVFRRILVTLLQVNDLYLKYCVHLVSEHSIWTTDLPTQPIVRTSLLPLSSSDPLPTLTITPSDYSLADRALLLASMFVVSACEDADFTVSFMDAMFDAINGSSPFVNALYPDNMTLEGREKAVDRHLELKRLDASQKWEKGVETTTGEIAGMAMWNVYEREKPLEMDLDGPPGYWPTEDEREFAKAIFRSFMEYRRKIIKETPGPVMCMYCCVLAFFLCPRRSHFRSAADWVSTFAPPRRSFGHDGCTQIPIPRSWRTSHEVGHRARRQDWCAGKSLS